MIKPIFRKVSECKDKGLGYIISGDEAEIIESNIVTVKKGVTTDESSHHNEEEVYIILSGKGRVKVGDIEKEVGRDTVIYIPRNAIHQSTGLSDEDFVFLCVAIYFDKTPKEQ
ncbi:MAG TPA: cupin domain-containing protein [Clostridiales bacterium]|nr:cupin domain-containing protein [Clostridiales bacterium]